MLGPRTVLFLYFFNKLEKGKLCAVNLFILFGKYFYCRISTKHFLFFNQRFIVFQCLNGIEELTIPNIIIRGYLDLKKNWQAIIWAIDLLQQMKFLIIQWTNVYMKFNSKCELRISVIFRWIMPTHRSIYSICVWWMK